MAQKPIVNDFEPDDPVDDFEPDDFVPDDSPQFEEITGVKMNADPVFPELKGIRMEKDPVPPKFEELKGINMNEGQPPRKLLDHLLEAPKSITDLTSKHAAQFIYPPDIPYLPEWANETVKRSYNVLGHGMEDWSTQISPANIISAGRGTIPVALARIIGSMQMGRGVKKVAQGQYKSGAADLLFGGLNWIPNSRPGASAGKAADEVIPPGFPKGGSSYGQKTTDEIIASSIDAQPSSPDRLGFGVDDPSIPTVKYEGPRDTPDLDRLSIDTPSSEIPTSGPPRTPTGGYGSYVPLRDADGNITELVPYNQDFTPPDPNIYDTNGTVIGQKSDVTPAPTGWDGKDLRSAGMEGTATIPGSTKPRYRLEADGSYTKLPDLPAEPVKTAPAPAKLVEPTKTAPTTINLSGMGEAISENYYKRMWENLLKKGHTLDFEDKSPLDQKMVTEAFKRGEIRSVEDVKRVAQASVTSKAPAPVAPKTAATVPVTPAPKPAVRAIPPLPSGLEKAAPKYGKVTPKFASDLDRALYIIAEAKPSSADKRYLRYVMDVLGIDEKTARALGRDIKARMKPIVAKAKGEEVDIPQLYHLGDVIPDPRFAGEVGVRSGITGDDIPDRLADDAIPGEKPSVPKVKPHYRLNSDGTYTEILREPTAAVPDKLPDPEAVPATPKTAGPDMASADPTASTEPDVTGLADEQPSMEGMTEDAAPGWWERAVDVFTGRRDSFADKRPRRSAKMNAKTLEHPFAQIVMKLRQARQLNREQKDLLRIERGVRIGGLQNVQGRGREWLAGAKQAMAGEYTKLSFDPLDLSDDHFDILQETIAKSRLTDLQKMRAVIAIDKLSEGVIPQPKEIDTLSSVFSKLLTRDLHLPNGTVVAGITRDQSQTVMQEFWKAIFSHDERFNKFMGNLDDASRSLMSSGELSAPLRQGQPLWYKEEWRKAWMPMIKAGFSDRAYTYVNKMIERAPHYKYFKDKLHITDVDSLTNREEGFVNSVVGYWTKGSERAYSAFLNKLRSDTANNLMTKIMKAELPEKLRVAKEALLKKHPNARPKRIAKHLAREEHIFKEYMSKHISNYVNTTTGRGELKVWGFDLDNPLVKTAFYAPHLTSSRINMLTSYSYYMNLPKPVRIEALKALVGMGSFVAIANGLGALAGGKLTGNFTDADAGKVRFGDTRIDTGAGFLQTAVAGARMFSNLYTNSRGEKIKFNSGYGTPNDLEIMLRYAENKLSPMTSLGVSLARGEDFRGQPLNIPVEVGKRFVSMYKQDMYDLFQTDEDIWLEFPKDWRALSAAPLSFFGAGSQTYPDTPPKKR